MTDLKVKRAYDKYDPEDGLRVLVDKNWPKDANSKELHYDVWEKKLAPSTELKKWLYEDVTNRWTEFAKSYEKELTNSTELKQFINKIKHYNKVTLVYLSKDTERNNAKVLIEVLKQVLSEETEK